MSRTRTLVGSIVIIAVVAGLGGGAFVWQRGRALEAEHVTRRALVIIQENLISKLKTGQRDLETKIITAGMTPLQAREYATRVCAPSFVDAYRDLQSAQAALDAFYLAHPKYRGRGYAEAMRRVEQVRTAGD